MQENSDTKPAITNSVNISNEQPSRSVTQGEDMLWTYVDGFVGGLIQFIGFGAAVLFFFAMIFGDSFAYSVGFLMSLAAIFGGGFLRYKSKQTVQIGGKQTTKSD